VDGSAATCIEARPQGGVTFTSRNGSDPGYQPFTKAASFQIWARTNGTSGTAGVRSTSSGLYVRYHFTGRRLQKEGSSIDGGGGGGDYESVINIGQNKCTLSAYLRL